MKYILYHLYYAIAWTLGFLPLPLLYVLSDVLFVISFRVVKYRKEIVFRNLTNSFPDKTPQEIYDIARQFYKHLNDVLVENIALIHLSEKQILQRCRYHNLDLLNSLYEKEQSVIIVGGHYGNWEWLCSLAPLVQHKGLAVYQPLNNKFIDRVEMKLRSKYGASLLSYQTAIKHLLRFHNNHILTMTYFLSDQSPHRARIEYWTNFLHQDTPVFLGVEKIARKTNQAVVFVYMQKSQRGVYDIYFEMLAPAPSMTKQFEITNMYISRLEEVIRQNPEYWLWSHRRWKYRRYETVNKSTTKQNTKHHE